MQLERERAGEGVETGEAAEAELDEEVVGTEATEEDEDAMEGEELGVPVDDADVLQTREEAGMRETGAAN